MELSHTMDNWAVNESKNFNKLPWLFPKINLGLLEKQQEILQGYHISATQIQAPH